MSEYKAWFQCINEECGETYPLYEVIYRCRRCGNLLEVMHDLKPLRERSAKEWKDLFDFRYRRQIWPYGSSVWGKKEWVCPYVEDENVVSMYEGATNVFWAERFGKQVGIEDLWIKMCGNSHTGSFKDLGMTVLVSVVKQMVADGKNIPAVACASTGDTSASLAAYCAAAGIKAIVFLPRNKVSIAQLVQPISNGALVLSLDTDFDGCMEMVQKICGEHNIYLANSMNSLRIEGQKTVSIELCQQFDWEVPDWVIIPGGNLGNISALGKGFLIMYELGLVNRLPRLVCAQAQNANPLYLSYLNGFKEFRSVKAQKTLASAIQIGNPVSVNKAIKTLKTFDGIVEQASEEELSDAAALVDRTGTFNCPHTGVAIAAFLKLRERKIFSPKDRVVIISTAHGLKFVEFKVGYHQGTLEGVFPKYANTPVELPPDINAVQDVIFGNIKEAV
ncbi:MAG TPA: threonine synthase [Thermodesulfobacteriota bacterium]|nr:threonine synthase [Thermodesulfobacteriota bacterium]